MLLRDGVGKVVGVCERLDDDLGAGGEVVVHERGRDAGLAGHVGDAHRGGSGGRNGAAGGVQDQVLAIRGGLGHDGDEA